MDDKTYRSAQGISQRTKPFNETHTTLQSGTNKIKILDGSLKSAKKVKTVQMSPRSSARKSPFVQSSRNRSEAQASQQEQTPDGGDADAQMSNPYKRGKKGSRIYYNHNDSDGDERRSNFWTDCPLWCNRKMRYFSCNCKKMGGKDNKINNDDYFEDYSSGESDSEYTSMFAYLPTEQKTKRILHLWKRFTVKARGVNLILRLFQEAKGQIKVQGTLNIKNNNVDTQDLIPRTYDTKYVIMPESQKKQRWDILIALLLVYTGLAVPLRVAFYDIASPGFIVFELLIDFCFITDIVLTFFSAYEKHGIIEVRHKQIAQAYLQGWFWIDLISSIPFQLFELNHDNQSSGFLQIVRLFRVLRLLKLLRFTKKNGASAQLAKSFQLTSSVASMVGLLIFVLFLTHLYACFWFLQARWGGFEEESWVVQEGLLDADKSFQYVVAFYWALQTLTTVGFGDITIKTVTERIYAIIWMIIGVAFYSYAIGNMTNMIASLDADNEILNEKISVLKDLKARTKMPNQLYNRIKRHMENNQRSNNSFTEQEKLLNDLPQQLRNQVIECTHGEVIDRIDFFKDKEHEFLFTVMPELKPLKLLEGDTLYQQGDHAEEVYMISAGQIKLNVDIVDFLIGDGGIVAPEQNSDEDDYESDLFKQSLKNLSFPFIKYLEGSYFGDVDILANGRRFQRDSTAVAASKECHFFILPYSVIQTLRRNFEKEIKQMEKLAMKRRENHKMLISLLAKKIRLIQSQRGNSKIGIREFYELNLMSMEEMEMKDFEEKTFNIFNQSDLSRNRSMSDLSNITQSEVAKTRADFVNSELQRRKTSLMEGATEIDKQRKLLKIRQEGFTRRYFETLTNFQFNMDVLDKQSEKMSRLCTELQHGSSQANMQTSMRSLEHVLTKIEENTRVSNQCLNTILASKKK